MTPEKKPYDRINL